MVKNKNMTVLFSWLSRLAIESHTIVRAEKEELGYILLGTMRYTLTSLIKGPLRQRESEPAVPEQKHPPRPELWPGVARAPEKPELRAHFPLISPPRS